MTVRQTNLSDLKRQLCRYSVTSDSGNTYTVSEVAKHFVDSTCKVVTQWQCSCPAWKFRTPRQDCKHIEHVRAHCQN